jgi:hypothetical protein
MNDEKDIYGGAMDEPDERDFLAGSVADVKLKPIPWLPKIVRFDRNAVTLYTQKGTNSCTAQAAANCLEMTYWNLYKKKIHVGVLDHDSEGTMGMWKYQLRVHPKTGSEDGGDFTRSAFRALVHRSENGGIPVDGGLNENVRISAFAKIERDADVFRQWIYAGHAIAVSGDVLRSSVGNSNWYMAKKEGYLAFPKDWKKVGGHAVCILTGYDFSNGNAYFTGAQSYGDDYGVFGDGTFRIRAEEIENLHQSCWVCFPEGQNLHEEKVQAAKDIMRAKKIYAIAEKCEWNTEIAEKIKEKAHELAEQARDFLKRSS